MGEYILAMMNTHTLLLLVYLSCLCSRTYSIKCYQCDTSFDGECDDPYVGSVTHLIDCDQIVKEMENEYFCRKNTQTVQGTKKVIRSCAQINNMDKSSDTCYESQGSGYYKRVCDCYYDRCNSATLSTVSLLLALTS